MSQFNHHGQILPMDTGPADAVDTLGMELPVSQDEIEDLLYGEGRGAEERLDRLRELRLDLQARGAGDYFVEQDAPSLIAEIDRAIERLEVATGQRDGGELSDPVSLDVDPLAHRETLSPDDDELLDLAAADEASIADELQTAGEIADGGAPPSRSAR